MRSDAGCSQRTPFKQPAGRFGSNRLMMRTGRTANFGSGRRRRTGRLAVRHPRCHHPSGPGRPGNQTGRDNGCRHPLARADLSIPVGASDRRETIRKPRGGMDHRERLIRPKVPELVALGATRPRRAKRRGLGHAVIRDPEDNEFSVAVNSYQWLRDGQPIWGATAQYAGKQLTVMPQRHRALTRCRECLLNEWRPEINDRILGNSDPVAARSACRSRRGDQCSA